MRANTDWFRDAKWGVFIHYLAGLPSADEPEGTTVESWNARIDALEHSLRNMCVPCVTAMKQPSDYQ